MDIVSLLEELVNGLISAEDIFFQNPKDFYSLEKSVKTTTEAFSAAFPGNVLTSMNQKIYEDGWRKCKYTVQRTNQRTRISSVGDVTFDNTYYRSKVDGVHHYLVEEILGLDAHERFTEEAEVVLLTEALKTSYSEAASVLPSKQEISKTRNPFLLDDSLSGLNELSRMQSTRGKSLTAHSNQIQYKQAEMDDCAYIKDKKG